MEYLHQLARPFYKQGSSEACLLIHGFTGSPAHMRYLGQVLHDEGYTAAGVLLPGHGTSLEQMEKTDRQDWLAKVEKEFHKLKQEHERVYVLGLSLGGILTLLLAQKYNVDKIVSIAAPIKLQNKLAYLTPILKYFQRFRGWSGETIDQYDIAYPAMPVKSVPELLKLIKQAKKNLAKIDCPALLIQPKKDGTVKPVSAEIIHEKIASEDKEILWLEESGHVCTVGPEKGKIHKQVIEFLNN
ncbi:MAG: alpha/beta hydrolase [Bacillota bacterium]